MPAKRRVRSNCYVDSEKTLFVPTEAMLLVHEATRPNKVAERASLSSRWWTKLIGGDTYTPDEKRWLSDWLYHCNGPDLKVLYPSDRQRRRRGADEGQLFVDEEMLAFRSQSSLRSTVLWLRENGVWPVTRGRDRTTGGGLVSEPYHWLAKYSNLAWFEPWLCRGKEPPAEVTVATQHQVGTCRFAWHYEGICKATGITANTYRSWFDVLPGEPWLFWLYGDDPPADSYVVPPKLLALRDRLSIHGICAAAQIHRSNHCTWLKDSVKRQALREAVDAVKNGGHSPSGPAWQQLKELEPHHSRKRMLEQMLRFARASTLSAALRDVGLIDQSYRRELRKAPQLSAFLTGDRRRFRTIGVVAPNLFVSSEEMRRFRHEAKRRQLPLQAFAISESLMRLWMLDWIVPRRKDGAPLESVSGETERVNLPPPQPSTRERDIELAQEWLANKESYRTKRAFADAKGMNESACKKALKRGLDALATQKV